MIHTQATRLEDEDFAWLVGRTIAALVHAEPGSWWFDFSGGGQVATHGGIWRLSSPAGTVACSGDHGHPFGLPAPFDAIGTAREALGDARVIAARVRDGAPDLELCLSNGLTLELLVFSIGYESWETRDPSGRCVVVRGARDASTWQMPPEDSP